LAAAAIAVLLLRSPSVPAPAQPHEAYARIESSSAAGVEHTLAATPSGGTDEIVRVHAGTLHLAVPAPRAGDRVRIATADAEIEGAGEYEVVVAAEALSRVTVTSGSATVRLVGKQEAVFLAAGQTWRAAVQTADLTTVVRTPAPTAPATATAPAPAPGTTTAKGSPIETSLDAPIPPPPIAPSPIAPSPKRAIPTVQNPPAATPPNRRPATIDGSPIETELPQQLTTDAAPIAPAVTPGSEIERHFRVGWSLLKANKLAEAITELGAAADAGDSPLAADARYYQAIALVKAKRGAEAERALVQFLDHAPTSTRRGRAAMMLGRLLADRGDAKTARDWFAVAAKDSDATVAAAAKAALDAR
ncbi:MAG: tetratricopeptide repeat protein, partial [Polyangiales bacterium]